MRTWILVGAAAVFGVVFMVVLQMPVPGDTAVVALSNLVQLAAAGLASLTCGRAARRSRGRQRAAWWWLTVATAGWAGGQAVWTYYEVALGREVPFPSPADAGFLVFPLAAAVGLVVWLGTQAHQLVARGRDLLDGGIIPVSLLVLSWVTALGTVASDGGPAGLPLVLSIAYPVGDLVLATLVLTALARATGAERTTLAVLALGWAAWHWPTARTSTSSVSAPTPPRTS